MTGHHNDVGLEVANQLHLLLSIAARYRNDSAAEALGPVVCPKTAGEQSVSVGDLHDIARPTAGC